jgi:biopolymer transport protein ExbD
VSRKRKRKQDLHEYKDVELNVMPFIDVFSMLNTFLLFSAVFIAIGIHEVQVPFLSNAAPPKTESGRVLLINVSVEKDKVEVVTVYSMEPADEKKNTYDLTAVGLTDMHKRLVEIRREHKDVDKLTLYSEDDVSYKDLSLVIDGIKLRREGDPVFTENNEDPTKAAQTSMFLFPKVVMGSVIL